jgi:hypothetical protein
MSDFALPRLQCTAITLVSSRYPRQERTKTQVWRTAQVRRTAVAHKITKSHPTFHFHCLLLTSHLHRRNGASVTTQISPFLHTSRLQPVGCTCRLSVLLANEVVIRKSEKWKGQSTEYGAHHLEVQECKLNNAKILYFILRPSTSDSLSLSFSLFLAQFTHNFLEGEEIK